MSMVYRTRTRQFSATAKWLHWVVAIVMLWLLPVAIGFSFLPDKDRAEAIPAHASIGLIIVALTLIRLGWRSVSPPPPTPEQTPHWAKSGAKIGHFLLYALIIWQGMIGLWMAASSSVAIRFLGGFNLSELAPASPEIVEAIRPLHDAGAWLFLAVLATHILGALWHHFKMHDDVLVRMLPFSGLWYRLSGEDYARRWRFPSSYLDRWPRRLQQKGDGI